MLIKTNPVKIGDKKQNKKPVVPRTWRLFVKERLPASSPRLPVVDDYSPCSFRGFVLPWSRNTNRICLPIVSSFSESTISHCNYTASLPDLAVRFENSLSNIAFNEINEEVSSRCGNANSERHSCREPRETSPPIKTLSVPWEGRDIGLLTRVASPSSKNRDLAPLQILNKKAGPL